MSRFEHFITKGGKRLRRGYTTGTCAALAAKAATMLLLTGTAPEQASLLTPKGLTVTVDILAPSLQNGVARCAVRKDAGDDTDVTDGILVWAEAVKSQEPGVIIDGGKGIGRVTRPGLNQPVGAAAINSIPRQEIANQAKKVCRELDYHGGISFVISAPEGEALAKRTFNPRLGIEGGISILGTSGIVEPQSVQALVDTIEAEIKMLSARGEKALALVPGNYGKTFLTDMGLTLPAVKCSNYIGDALDLAGAWGFTQVLLVGHLGKLVKLAGGIMNTHSKIADCRGELFTAHAALAGADKGLLERLMDSVTSDECIGLLDEASLRGLVIASLLEKIQFHLTARAQEKFQAGAVVFSNKYGVLGITSGANAIIEEWKAHG